MAAALLLLGVGPWATATVLAQAVGQDIGQDVEQSVEPAVAPNLAHAAPAPSAFDQLDLLVDVRHEIVTQYVEAPDQQAMTDAAVRAMVESLDDPYTNYLSVSELEPFDKEVRGTFSGIGAEVRFDPDARRVRIVSPLEDSPAWHAGVMAGDLVLDIDGQSTLDMPLNEAINRLTGPEGAPVTITVRRESGQENTLVITRARINVPSIKGLYRDTQQQWQFLIDQPRGIGYIRILQFTPNTVDDLRHVLEQLLARDLRGLIIDLRFDPGGMLEVAVAIADMFLPEGRTIVSVRGRSVPPRVFTSTAKPTIPPIPLVVLANEASASASEILTGALAENDRALFVGTRTFGKGSVQQVRMLASGQGAIKITNAYYYLPSGRNIHRLPDADRWGVDPPDGFYVAMSPEQVEAMLQVRRDGDVLRPQNNGPTHDVTPQWVDEQLKDPQLAAALTALHGKLDSGDWPQVGEDGSADLALQARRQQLERQRQRLERAVDEIDQRLARLLAGLPEQQGEQTEEADDAIDIDEPFDRDVDGPDETPGP